MSDVDKKVYRDGLTNAEEMLFERGWLYSGGKWSRKDAFDCTDLCLSDALKIDKILLEWSKS
jgi:hypothetical protein